MKPIIEIKHVTKAYQLSHASQLPYRSLREEIGKFLRQPFQREQTESFLALNDISLKIERGETLGIIGANGAGKSTLLKILSRITPPTKGQCILRGRVSSLLEVGTGFHPELTGRENIYLNGAVLGMTRTEIKERFKQIVDFAEIEQFLDTPVKRYSSGMYTRLAFAVAAHLEPDILIVDEVLAVGDARFQKKCLGKMNEVSQKGRTVIFVSHTMSAISDLCKRTILLDKGKIISAGPTSNVIARYLSAGSQSIGGQVDLTKPGLRRNSLSKSVFQFTQLKIINTENKINAIVKLGDRFSLLLRGILHRPVENVVIGLTIQSARNVPLYNSQITLKERKLNKKPGEIEAILSFDPNIFGPGIYTIGLGASGPGTVEWIPEALTFSVERNESSEIDLEYIVYEGTVTYPNKWEVKKI